MKKLLPLFFVFVWECLMCKIYFDREELDLSFQFQYVSIPACYNFSERFKSQIDQIFSIELPILSSIVIFNTFAKAKEILSLSPDTAENFNRFPNNSLNQFSQICPFHKVDAYSNSKILVH